MLFESGKATLTPEAAQIVDAALAAYQDCAHQPILLEGFTDSFGKNSANLTLAAKRNNSVLRYLVAHGVAQGVIVSHALGEERQRVPTADGVHEVQNNRVEIQFGPLTPSGTMSLPREASSSDPSPQATGYGTILVLGSNASRFRYIRQDLFNNLPTTPGASADAQNIQRLSRVRSDNVNFAVQPVGSRYPVKIGGTYLFIPECEGPVLHSYPSIAKGGDQKVTVACP